MHISLRAKIFSIACGSSEISVKSYVGEIKKFGATPSPLENTDWSAPDVFILYILSSNQELRVLFLILRMSRFQARRFEFKTEIK